MTSVEDFLAVLDKSKLLSGEQFVKAQRLAEEATDAPALARTLARENLISRWQAGQLLAGRSSLRLGKYKLIQLLGRGGMGSVFLAEHVTMNRRVALKVVPRSIADNRASLERFFAEARAIASLDHPNIVQAYSVDTDQDRYFIVMEFVDGQDLEKIVQGEGPMKFERAADYIRQAADGLAHAHARNLVHCDIKPSNLLINNHNVLKILDLGLARLNKADDSKSAGSSKSNGKESSPGDTLGTVDYMAPEQALGTANFDHRADIYSLGCTLYYLLAGHPPFPDGTLAQRIMKHQAVEPQSILIKRPDAPKLMVEVCQRMMAKDPADRYQSAQEVATALSAWKPAASQTAIRPVQAVKVIEEDIPEADEGASWLEALTVRTQRAPVADPIKNRASASSVLDKQAVKPTDKDTLSGKTASSKMLRPKRKTGAKATVEALLVSLKTKLNWFNTPRRKIGGALAVGTTLALGLAAVALPFALGGPKPPGAIQVIAKGEGSAGDRAHQSSTATSVMAVSSTTTLSTAIGKIAAADKVTSKDSPLSKPTANEPPKPQPTATPPKKSAVADVPTDKAKPKVDPKPMVEPVPDKPEPKPAEVAKKSTSLEHLLADVDLPTLGSRAANAISLGTVEAEPSAKLDVQLLGGETVAKGQAKFIIEAETQSQPPGWLVAAEAKDKSTTPVARVWREESDLKVRWADDVKGSVKTKANLLRNCGLLVSADGKSRFVALSKPQTTEGLTIDFESRPNPKRPHLRLTRDSLPDAAVLRLQIMPLDKALPKPDFSIGKKNPSQTHSRGGKGAAAAEPLAGDTINTHETLTMVLKKDKNPPIHFMFAFDATNRTIDVHMAVSCEIAGSEFSFDRPSLEEIRSNADRMIKVAEVLKKNKKPVLESELQAAKASLTQLDSLEQIAATITQKMKIPFQIYALVGSEPGQKVVLFESKQGEDPGATLPETDRKGNNKTKKKGRGAAPDMTP